MCSLRSHVHDQDWHHDRIRPCFTHAVFMCAIGQVRCVCKALTVKTSTTSGKEDGYCEDGQLTELD